MMSHNNHNKDKIYHEYLAKLVLEYIKPDRYGKLSCSDKPDLRGSKGIDVEVTIIDLFQQRFASSLFDKLKNKTKKEIGEDPHLRKACKQLYAKRYSLLFIHNKAIGFGPKEATIEDLEQIKNAFSSKYIKLPTYSEKTDLFMYSPAMEWYSIEEVKDFAEWIKQLIIRQERFFGRIYVFGFQKCYEIECTKPAVFLHTIDDDILASLIKESMLFSGYNSKNLVL